MFDVDVKTCVALFLTNILHLKPYVTKLPRKPCCATVLFYSTVKIKIVSVTSEKIRYFFTVEKYQFYSHLICMEFTACDKINVVSRIVFIWLAYLSGSLSLPSLSHANITYIILTYDCVPYST